MMKRNSIFLVALLLLSVVFILSSCKKEKDAPDFDTNGPEDLFVWEDFPNGLRLSQAEVFEIDLGVAMGQEASVKITNTSYRQAFSATTFDYKQFWMSGTQGIVEFIKMPVRDTIWKCETWTPDSSSRTVVFYNRDSRYPCSGDFRAVQTYYIPPMFTKPVIIASSYQWEAWAGNIAEVNNSSNDILDNNNVHVRTLDATIRAFAYEQDAAYIPFRWKVDVGTYKYGSLSAMTETGGDLVIYGYSRDK